MRMTQKQSRWIGAGLALLALQSLAQERPESAGYVNYSVQSGDNLSAVVGKYLTGADALAVVIRMNNLDNPDLLQVGQELKLPRSRLQFRKADAVVSAMGCAQAQRQRGDSRRPLQLGDGVQEGDVLSTPAGCPVLLSLEDSSSVQLVPGSVVLVKALRFNKLQPSPEVDFQLQGGRVEVQVPRKRGSSDAPFEIRTSTSMAGIRGTEFRVGFDAEKRSTQLEVLTGRVAAMGREDQVETPVAALQGLSISAEGRAQAVESLPAAVQFVESQTEGDGAYTLRFSANSNAVRYRAVWSQEANATRLSPQTEWASPQLMARLTQAEASFVHLRGLTASGLEGANLSLRLCRAYVQQRTPRCDVRFDVSGSPGTHLRLLRQQSGAPQVVFDAALPDGANDQAVMRGLWDGVYQWTLTRQLPSGARVQQEGQFQLVPISGGRG